MEHACMNMRVHLSVSVNLDPFQESVKPSRLGRQEGGRGVTV